MFCQLLAVSMGRSHVVAWPGRPLGGQSSAPAVTESPEVWPRLWGLQVQWGSCGQAQPGRRCCGMQGRGGVLPGAHSPATSQRLARATPAVVTAVSVTTHAQTRSHSVLTPGLALPASHGPVLRECHPPQDEDETRRLGGRAGPRTMWLTGQSWAVGPGGQLWSLPPPCRLYHGTERGVGSRPSSVSGASGAPISAGPTMPQPGACSEGGSEGPLL